MNEELLDQVKIVTRDQIKYDIDSVKPIESLSPYINVEELPSKFLPYPKGSKISYKTFSYGELEQWANTSLADEDKIKLALSGIKTFSNTPFIYLLLGILDLVRTQFATYKYLCITNINECGR